MDASKPKFDDGLDVIKGAGERQLLNLLRKQAPQKILFIYAIGDMHFAWVDRGRAKPLSKEEAAAKEKELAEAKAKADLEAKKASEDEEFKKLEAEEQSKAATGAVQPQAN